jgi:hypothetical protein
LSQQSPEWRAGEWPGVALDDWPATIIW